MTPAPSLVDQLLLKQSANAAFDALTAAGYAPVMMHLHARVGTLIRDGKRKPIPHKDRGDTYFQPTDIPKGASLEGSERLLEACLRMYERKANRMGQTMEEAMLTALYAPADVESWRAAA